MVTRIIPKDPAKLISENLRVSVLGVIKFRKRKKELESAAQAYE